MLERILIAGAGGQGVILTGKILANAALRTVPHITFFPSYGVEVRGGASNCQVVLSSDSIASPVQEVLDSMLIMNQESADRFVPSLRKGGLCIVNASMVSDNIPSGAVCVPATETARDMGDTRMANFILLGAWLARRGEIVSSQEIENTLSSLLARKSDMVDNNIRALHAGMKL